MLNYIMGCYFLKEDTKIIERCQVAWVKFLLQQQMVYFIQFSRALRKGLKHFAVCFREMEPSLIHPKYFESLINLILIL